MIAQSATAACWRMQASTSAGINVLDARFDHLRLGPDERQRAVLLAAAKIVRVVPARPAAGRR